MIEDKGIWVSKLGIVHEQQASHEVLYEVNLSQKRKDYFILWASLLPLQVRVKWNAENKGTGVRLMIWWP